MKVIDNFLPQEFFDLIINTVIDKEFPWYYHTNSAYNVEGKEDKVSQFNHIVIYDGDIKSSLYDAMLNVVEIFKKTTKLNIKGIGRIKLNLLTQKILTPKEHRKTIHKDVEEDSISFILYLNDSDGDTIFYNENKTKIVNKVTPKANRCVWFKSNQWHHATPPINTSARYIINFVLN
jgi:hypothetical protein